MFHSIENSDSSHIKAWCRGTQKPIFTAGGGVEQSTFISLWHTYNNFS